LHVEQGLMSDICGSVKKARQLPFQWFWKSPEESMMNANPVDTTRPPYHTFSALPVAAISSWPWNSLLLEAAQASKAPLTTLT
jgi:hypothetical protein